MCLRISEKEAELEDLLIVNENPVDIGHDAGQDEIRLAKTASIIAKRFGVPVEAVDIHVAIGPEGTLVYNGGLVFLSGEDIFRLVGER